MNVQNKPRATFMLCAWLWAGAVLALDGTVASAPAANATPGAGVSSSAVLVNPAPGDASIGATSAATTSVPSEVPPESVDSGPAPLSATAVAGIPLEDGGELVLGPEEKISSDDHAAAAALKMDRLAVPARMTNAISPNKAGRMRRFMSKKNLM